MTNGHFSPESSRLDDAARAGWLYYVAGNTQDEIARKLGVSRQTAQRLVAMAISERLVKVRLDHPIGRCMDLAAALRARFGLVICEVAPSDPDAPDLLAGIAIAAAAEVTGRVRAQRLEHLAEVVAVLEKIRLVPVVEAVPVLACLAGVLLLVEGRDRRRLRVLGEDARRGCAFVVGPAAARVGIGAHRARLRICRRHGRCCGRGAGRHGV